MFKAIFSTVFPVEPQGPQTFLYPIFIHKWNLRSLKDWLIEGSDIAGNTTNTTKLATQLGWFIL